MAKSAGEKPPEDSHEQAFIEYEERMAASASVVRSSIAHIYTPERGSAFSNTHLFMLEIRRQNADLIRKASKNNAGMADLSVRTEGEGSATYISGSEMGGGKEENPKGTSAASWVYQSSEPLWHRLSI